MHLMQASSAEMAGPVLGQCLVVQAEDAANQAAIAASNPDSYDAIPTVLLQSLPLLTGLEANFGSILFRKNLSWLGMCL